MEIKTLREAQLFDEYLMRFQERNNSPCDVKILRLFVNHTLFECNNIRRRDSLEISDGVINW